MTGILFLKLFYRCGFKREGGRSCERSAVAIGSLLQTRPEGAMRESMQAFLSCVNAVSLYHMTHALPLRLEAYNDLVNGDATVRDRKNVLIIEDIVDSGNTLSKLLPELQKRGPASLKVCALLDKPERRVLPFQANYVGFTIPDAFVVGYGLDFDQHYRQLPYIGVLKPSVYE